MFPSLPARFKVPYLLKNDYSRPCSQSGGLRFRTHSSDLSKVYDACLQCHWGRQRRADIMFNFTTPPTSHPLVSSVGKHSAPEIVDPPSLLSPPPPSPTPDSSVGTSLHHGASLMIPGPAGSGRKSAKCLETFTTNMSSEAVSSRTSSWNKDR